MATRRPVGQIEVQPVQCRPVRAWIAEAQVTDFDTVVAWPRRRAGRIDHRGLGVDDGEQPSGRGQCRLQLLERQRQRRDGLEGGQREQRQHRQLRRCQGAVVYQRDAEPEHAPQGQVGAQAHRALADAGDAAHAVLIADQRAAGGIQPAGMGVGGTVDQQFGQPLGAVDSQLAQLGFGRDHAPARAGAESARRPGQQHAGQQQHREQQQCQGQVVQRREQEKAGTGGRRHQHRNQHADVKVVQRVDVGADAAQQIGAVVLLQARRRQRLQVLVEPDPQAGELAQRRLVIDQPLQIAPGGAADGAAADQGRRREIVHRHTARPGHGHGGDEPAGHRHQRHVGHQRQQRHQEAAQHPDPIGLEQRPESFQLVHAASGCSSRTMRR